MKLPPKSTQSTQPEVIPAVWYRRPLSERRIEEFCRQDTIIKLTLLNDDVPKQQEPLPPLQPCDWIWKSTPSVGLVGQPLIEQRADPTDEVEPAGQLMQTEEPARANELA